MLNTLFFLIITAVAIRVMGEEFYGLWMALNAVLLFSGFGTLGIGSIVNKFAAEAKKTHEIEEIITSAVVILLPMAVLISLVIILSSGWIASRIAPTELLESELRQGLVITALSIFPQFLLRVPQGFLFSRLENKIVRVIEFAANLALWVGIIWIAYETKNLVWMALWGFFVQLGTLLAYSVVVAQLGFLRWRFRFDILRAMMNFSLFTFLESLAISLFQQFDRIIVGVTLGPVAVGAYSIGTSIGLRLSIITGQATEVMLPYASRQGASENYAGLYHNFRALSRITSLMLGLVTSLLILFMTEILALWISPFYAQSYANTFRIIVVGYAWLSLSRPGHQTLTGIGQVRFTALIYLGTTAMMLFGLFIGAQRFGLMGAAVANLTMLFLLAFNILTYVKLSGSCAPSDLFTDLACGFIVPILVFGLVVFVPFPFFSKILLALIFAGAVGISLWFDPFVKEHFLDNLLARFAKE